jgi:hypothetical protein
VWLGLYYVRLPGGLANMPEGSRVWFRRLAAQPVTIDREGELSVPLPIPWPDAGSYFVLSSVNEPGTIFRTRGPLDPRIGCFTLASAGILTLDSFESFGSDAALQSAYGINDAWGQNRAWLEVATPPHVSGGQRAAAFNYIIQQDAPDDYAGFERTFPAQDWRRYTTLHLWMESDRADIQLVVQFGESGGEVWRHRKYILSAGRSLLDLRLNEDTFSWADWSPQGNGRIDLEAVDYIGFFIGEAGQKSGTLYVDEIELR